jgi:hypothetical protein
MWHAFRYLIAGRPKWDVAWFDLDVVPDPQGWLKARLGPLAGFERIPECRPLTNAEAMTFAHLRHPPPDKWVA